MEEIYKNGPVYTRMDVYADFYYYGGGIYEPKTDKIVSAHAIKLIGWGETEDGVKFWVLENSFGHWWGEDGFVRMKKGTSGVGTWAIGCMPNLEEFTQVVG